MNHGEIYFVFSDHFSTDFEKIGSDRERERDKRAVLHFKCGYRSSEYLYFALAVISMLKTLLQSGGVGHLSPVTLNLPFLS